MSFRSKVLLLLQNDNTIYQLLLLGLLIASPSLHYLCYANSYDPLSLRFAISGVCLVAIAIGLYAGPKQAAAAQYVVVLSYLAVNNGWLLLGKNDFAQVYLFSSITIFIALTLFCKKRWQFVVICILNLAATLTAYITVDYPGISPAVLIVLLLTFSLIAYVSFLVMTGYNLKFQKAVNHVMVLNHSLRANDEKLRDKRKKLNALINSLNDVIFEFDEDKVCVNTWFRRMEGRVMDPSSCVGKRINRSFRS